MDPTSEILASLFGDLHPQRFARFGLGHFGFEGEFDTNLLDSFLVGFRIKNRLTEITKPPLSAQRYPSCLVRLAHLFLNFCGGRTVGRSYSTGVRIVKQKGVPAR